LELLACDAMADVLRQYGVACGHRRYAQQYLHTCCTELAAGQGPHVLTALRSLRRLLALYEYFDAPGGGGDGSMHEVHNMT
jgi:hypothetical protein